MPKTYIPIVEVFRLPAEADVDSIVDHLREGLARTLPPYPVLAGSLEPDDSIGKISVQVLDNSAIALYVNDMRATDVFPSYDELAVNNVRAHCLDWGFLLN
jgi:hypothetical protein